VIVQLGDFREIWLVDTEFFAPSGERPTPICLVAREFRSGQIVRLWQDELFQMDRPPYPIDRDSLFVGYLASAELGCHLALDWPMPESVLDLYVEFRRHTNGLNPYAGNSLIGALTWFGLDAMQADEKDAMRNLAIRGGPWSDWERRALLRYCESDVVALAKLLPAMERHLDLARAVVCRGRYMSAVARMEWAGVPIDTETLSRLRDSWELIKDRLIDEINPRFNVYVDGVFKRHRWAQWLFRAGISWPKYPSGELILEDDTFREMARSNADVALMRELRHSLDEFKLEGLTVGSDGRNRTLLSPFGASSSRNTPSNTKFIFGPSVWLRGLIKPEPGIALAYIDWSSQEYGIAAALSGDSAMMEAYSSGDVYLAFAKQAGRVPADGTKETHASERELCKACVLGIGYGMGELSLARRIDRSIPYARELLQLHHETYPNFWRWSEAAQDCAMQFGTLHTVFGWRIHVTKDANPRSLRNFPCQGNAAEMMRLACCLATERGISVVAPIHDAFLIEAPEWEIEEAVEHTQEAMAEASSIVLGGFTLRSNSEIVHWPDCYQDDRGREFWHRVMGLLDALHPCTPSFSSSSSSSVFIRSLLPYSPDMPYQPPYSPDTPYVPTK
jgi:hypothetical protein